MKACGFEHGCESLFMIFVTVFCLNAFFFSKVALTARPLNQEISLCFKMHFNPIFFSMVEGDMIKIGKIKIAADQAIDVIEDVPVEGCGDPERVVIGKIKDLIFFDEINTDQEMPPMMQFFSDFS